jgi:hypothetical protein
LINVTSLCDIFFSPVGATTWTGNSDCSGTEAGGGSATASFATSFAETHVGGRLVGVTASGNGTASSTRVNLETFASGSATYHVEFEVQQTVDVTFDGSLDTARGSMLLQQQFQSPIVNVTQTGSVTQRFTLTPGIWVVHITVSALVPPDPGTTSFRLDLRFH